MFSHSLHPKRSIRGRPVLVAMTGGKPRRTPRQLVKTSLWRDDPDGKTPFAVARVDGNPVVFGGIWEVWRSPEDERLQTFATITTDANNLLAGIQDRMPVIIEPENWPLWLGETEGGVRALLRPAAEDSLRFWPVGKAVGKVKNDGPELLEPVTLTEPTLL